MFRSVFPAVFRRALSPTALVLSILFSVTACAAKEAPSHVEGGGTLPASGRVVIRSGLAWMNEQAPLFRVVKASLVPLLQARGLTVVEAPPSTPAPLPGLPASGSTADAPTGVSPQPDAAAGDQAAADAAAKQAQHKPLKLSGYSVPAEDTKLPASVLGIAPMDPITVLFARSQLDGMPLLRRSGRIPGRIPPEMAADAGLADYTLVVRLTLVRPQSLHASGFGGGLTAAGTIGGVPTMGYGAPAPSAPPAPVYGGTPGDYARGYEAGNPHDTWNRQTDMLARDYMTKYGPQPQYATPPQTPAGPSSAGRVSSGVDPGNPALSGEPIFLPAAPGGVTGYALEMECYDLKNLSDKPSPIWQGTIQRRADNDGLAAALPEMLGKLVKK